MLDPAIPAGIVRASDEPPVELDRMEVKARLEDAGYDATGMGSYEQQLRDIPFSNDMISVDAIEDDPTTAEVTAELAIIATPSAVDLATGDSRVGLRGFPTPQMSNGFVRMGGIDVLNTARTIVIQGALVPVLGRAAPGGIQDFWTNRPRTSKTQRVEYSLSSHYLWLKILPQWIHPWRPIVGQEEVIGVGCTGDVDAQHLAQFALEEAGGRNDGADGGDDGFFSFQLHP
jgi:hypothetical protein